MTLPCSRNKLISLVRAGAIVVTLVSAGAAIAQNHGHNHGANGTGHDEVNMPGLRGENATVNESQELAILFQNFTSLSREVVNLPNGIRTITRSGDPAVMEILVSHVVGMLDRVARRDDPKIIIQSPTLDVFFQHSDAITTEVNVTDEGIVVVQTSENAEVVTALQTHAEEVSAMVDQGMHAVHMMMMERAGK